MLRALPSVMRSVRYPRSGLTALLALIAKETRSSAVSLLALSAEEDVAEILAVGGHKAAEFGLPGPAPWAKGKFNSSGSLIANESDEGPWRPGDRVEWRTTEGSACALTLIAHGEDVDASRLEEISGLAFLLGELIMARRSSANLQARLQAERQDRALLAASLQHDLRTPLSGILGFASILHNEDDMGSEETAEILSLMVAEAEHMAEVVADGLRREQLGPDAPLRLTLCDPVEIAQYVAEIARQARGGEVMLGVSEHTIFSDKARLTRALLNLVENAIRYSPEGSPVRMSGGPDGDHYRFVVADFGPGVPEEMIPTLFQPYSTDPERTDGTGLGLHSVATIASELKGRLSYARRDGWTTFSLWVPTKGPATGELRSSDVLTEVRS